MKINSKQSREIYDLVSDPSKKLTLRQIASKYGISVSSVRHHVRKWEKQVKTISKNNSKVAGALAAHQINLIEESALIMAVVKSSIQAAKQQGVSPEKTSGLINSWIKILELISNNQIIKRIENLEAAAAKGKP